MLNELGTIIEDIRIFKGISQKSFSASIGINHVDYVGIVAGIRELKFNTLIKMFDIYRIKPRTINVTESNKLIIVISGDLAAGKSTLAASLASHYKTTYYTKDHLKEILSDAVGYSSREENKMLSNIAVEIMLYEALIHLQNESSIILEANYHSFELKKIKELARKSNSQVVSIVLTGDIKVLYARFKERALSGTRHKTHLTSDFDTFEKYSEYIIKARNEERMFVDKIIDVTSCSEDLVYVAAKEYIDSVINKENKDII